MTRTVDLTQPWFAGMPTLDGDPQYGCSAAATLSEAGYRVSKLSASTHTGTHVDAPAHIFESGRTVDAFPVDWLCGRARVISVRAEEGQKITATMVQDQLVDYLNTPEPEPIVLFSTGWSQYFLNQHDRYAQHPYLSARLIEMLVASGIKVLGVDTFSPDAADSSELPVHKAALGADVAIIENLANLDALPAHVFFEAYPLPIRDGEAAPIRAVAKISDDI